MLYIIKSRDHKEAGVDLLSHARAGTVSSALGGFQVLFGMVRLVPLPIWTPYLLHIINSYIIKTNISKILIPFQIQSCKSYQASFCHLHNYICDITKITSTQDYLALLGYCTDILCFLFFLFPGRKFHLP